MQHGSGYLEVHLHSLANPHGRKANGRGCDWHEGGCDHQFDFCLTTENNDATCHYGSRSTATYENTYGITFGSTINGGLANPFTFAFPTSYPVSSWRRLSSHCEVQLLYRGTYTRTPPLQGPIVRECHSSLVHLPTAGGLPFDHCSEGR